MKPWFRHYVGMTRDDRLIEAAMRSKQPLERVVFVWCCILESASECDEGGAYLVAAETIAYQIRVPLPRIRAIFDALTEGGRIADGRIVQWSARQFESDTSRDRMRRHRAAKVGHGDADVTHRDVTVTDQSRAEQSRTEAGRPASAQAREPAASLPLSDDTEFKHACTEALGGRVKGSFKPMAALTGDRERLVDLLRTESARRTNPIGTWDLAATIATEMLAAPPPMARGSPAPPPPPDDGPRVNTPSGPRSVAFLRREHEAGRWSKLYGDPPGEPGCPIAAYLTPKPSPAPHQRAAE